MEKHLQVLNQALNKANQHGAFTLQESALVANSLLVVTQALSSPAAKENPIEKARQEAKERNLQNVRVLTDKEVEAEVPDKK